MSFYSMTAFKFVLLNRQLANFEQAPCTFAVLISDLFFPQTLTLWIAGNIILHVTIFSHLLRLCNALLPPIANIGLLIPYFQHSLKKEGAREKLCYCAVVSEIKGCMILEFQRYFFSTCTIYEYVCMYVCMYTGRPSVIMSMELGLGERPLKGILEPGSSPNFAQRY